MRKEFPQQDGQVGNAPIQYKEVNAIFDVSLIEVTTTKGRAIYVNEDQRDDYLAILTPPPSPLGRPIFFLKVDAYAMHFPHNDALIVTMHISCSRVSKILVDMGSSVNILYGHTLDRMEDTPELARKMILPQTQYFYMDLIRVRHAHLEQSRSQSQRIHTSSQSLRS